MARRWQAATGGQPERMVSGSDDFTMFLWSPSTSKQHIARMTGHVQTVNQVRADYMLRIFLGVRLRRARADRKVVCEKRFAREGACDE